MRIWKSWLILTVPITLFAVNLGVAASLPPDTTGSADMVVTVLPGSGGTTPNLQASELSVLQDKSPARVLRLERLTGENLQLYILLDDSTRSTSLGTHIQELKSFLESLPAATQVAIGYMRNGTAVLAQPFTADHREAANRIRLPQAVPGENGSPYFALSDLVKRWPSNDRSARRAVLMLTDGVDRYYGTSVVDDPYVDEAVNSALKNHVVVYSIYLFGSGLYGRGPWTQNIAQSRLIEASDQTGGNAYYEGFTDPVAIAPFLSDLQKRLENQYRVTIQANGKGVQPVKVHTETPGLKIAAPTRIYVR